METESAKLLEQSGEVPEQTGMLSDVPPASAEFRTMPQNAETFGKIPQAAERKENHTLTVRETARMFETAGVARTERSIINWCQPNRQGITRLDSYYDPNDRKYYITPQSVEAVIQEEIQRANKSTDASASEAFGSPETPVKNSRPETNTADDRKVKELERQVMDLKIANRGKDYLIEKLQEERTGFFDRLLNSSRKLGELENRLLQLGEGAGEHNATIL